MADKDKRKLEEKNGYLLQKLNSLTTPTENLDETPLTNRRLELALQHKTLELNDVTMVLN
jgi:hypothetical protein